MVLRQALDAQRHPLTPGQTVRFAHPLNEAEETARFTVVNSSSGGVSIAAPADFSGPTTITRVRAWEVEPC